MKYYGGKDKSRTVQCRAELKPEQNPVMFVARSLLLFYFLFGCAPAAAAVG